MIRVSTMLCWVLEFEGIGPQKSLNLMLKKMWEPCYKAMMYLSALKMWHEGNVFRGDLSQRWHLEMFCFFEPTAKNPKKDKEKHEILTFVKPKPANFLHFCLKKWLKWLFYYQNSCRLISCQSTNRCSSSFILKLQYIWYLDIKTCGTTQSQCITARSAQSLWLLKITSVN